jgi:capsular exopolysaccharide synthesis family protein
MPEGSNTPSPYRILRNPLSSGEPAWEGEERTFVEEDEVHLRDYLRVIRKHRRLVAAIFFATVASTALVTFTSTKLYTASVTLQIERQSPKLAPVQEIQPTDPGPGYEKYDYYQTQFEVLKSRSVAARVIRALDLASDERFTGGDKPSFLRIVLDWVRSLLPKGPEGEPVEEFGLDPKLIDRYLDHLDVDPVRNSRLVKVSFTSPDPRLAAEVANRHAEEFTNASLEQRLALTVRAKEFLERELAKAKDRVDAAEAALNRFRKEKGIVSLDGGPTDVVSERLADLNKRHTEAQAERIRLEGQYRLIQKRDYESLPDVLASPLIALLKAEVAKLEAEQAELAKKFKPGYPKMGEAIARTTEAKVRLDAEVRKIVAGIESAYLAAKSREESLERELEEQRQRALLQKDVGADYATLQRDVETARGLYANLLQRLKDVDVAEEIKVSNVSVVDEAAPPVRPSKPKTLLNLLLASFLGLGLGLGLAFFLEYLDDTLRTPEEVERRLGLPTLGIVPDFDRPLPAYAYANGGSRREARRLGRARPTEGAESRNGSESRELVVSAAPTSVVAEAYRTIRTAVLLSSADSPPQVILFTSGAAGEGKTVTAVNQAMTLVQSGARVVLVDADIRKPRLHSLFRVANGQGLSTLLAGQSELEAVLHAVALTNGNGAQRLAGAGELFVIPSGPMPPNPAELLSGRTMRETLARLRERFDFVVLDSPPVLPVTDAVLLSTLADGVVLVVRAQDTPTDVARKSCERLRYARAKILGVVLNDVDLTGGDYGGYYERYYSYYGERAGESEA